jgi:antitoxin component YwqK of YwqJK toxin-antitoxin module
MTKKPPKQGLHVEYHENGNKKRECNYENYKLHGECSAFNEEGKKINVGTYESGVLGKYANYGYHANGNLNFEINLIRVDLENWKGEWRNGKAITWYENGQKQTETNYVDDVIVGNTIEWHENGHKKSFESIEGGGYTTWYENGQKECEIFDSGIDLSTMIKFYENGQRKSKGFYKKIKRKSLNNLHVMHGPWTYYHENGQKQSEENFDNDSKQGNSTYYYDNGKKASEGVYKIFIEGGMSFSLEQGEWNYWNQSGLKSDIKNYKKGKVLTWDAWDEDGNVLDTKDRLDAENRPRTSRTHSSNNDIDWFDDQALTDDDKLLGESFWRDIL